MLDVLPVASPGADDKGAVCVVCHGQMFYHTMVYVELLICFNFFPTRILSKLVNYMNKFLVSSDKIRFSVLLKLENYEVK